MKKIIFIACMLAMTLSLGGCNTSSPGNERDVLIPTNLPPHITTNDIEVIGEYYDGDLTPGNDGSDLTE